MYDTETEILEALKSSQDDLPFEQMMDVEDSPLNQPVKEKGNSA